MSFSFAMVKPGVSRREVCRLLEPEFHVVRSASHQLSEGKIDHFYPDVYGAEFIAEHRTYYRSDQVMHLLLASVGGGPRSAIATRDSIRRSLVVEDRLRTHIHMPDSPGETAANVELVFGRSALQTIYIEKENDLGHRRLSLYRTLLGE